MKGTVLRKHPPKSELSRTPSAAAAKPDRAASLDYASTPTTHPRYSLSSKPSSDLLGQRFDSLAVINSFDAIAYGAQDHHRPQPQPQSQSQPHTPGPR
ncbi:hypothetical protein Q7P37_000947 [Cladosporium fusiforme]